MQWGASPFLLNPHCSLPGNGTGLIFDGNNIKQVPVSLFSAELHPPAPDVLQGEGQATPMLEPPLTLFLGLAVPVLWCWDFPVLHVTLHVTPSPG